MTITFNLSRVFSYLASFIYSDTEEPHSKISSLKIEPYEKESHSLDEITIFSVNTSINHLIDKALKTLPKELKEISTLMHIHEDDTSFLKKLSIKELSIFNIQITKLIEIIENINLESANDCIEDILKLKTNLKENSPFIPILQKFIDYCHIYCVCQYADLKAKNPTNLSLRGHLIHHLQLIRNIDTRMNLYNSLNLEKDIYITESLSVHQLPIIYKLQQYLKKKNIDSELTIPGLCYGLSILYGYYEFLDQKDDFFARIENLFNIDIDSFPENLATKIYAELTPEEKICEDFFNEILYLQGSIENGMPKDFCSSLHFVSSNDKILNLSSQLIYSSFFEYDEERENYTSMTKTLMSIVNFSEEPKYLHILTGDHSLGIFFRNGQCFLYEPNDTLPSMPYDSSSKKEMISLTQRLTQLLDSKQKPVSLGIDIIFSESLDKIDELKKTLYETINMTPSKESYNKSTPLHFACSYNDLDAIQLFIDSEADVNQVDLKGITPLHITCYRGDSKSTQLLIEKNANIHQINVQQHTPLHLACCSGDLSTVKLLLSHGADSRQTDINGWTPIALADYYGHTDLVDLLIGNDPFTLEETTMNPYFHVIEEVKPI